MTKVILAAVALLFTTSSLFAATWRSVGPPGGPIHDIGRSISDPDVLMVAAEDGIYRSEDRGRTWVPASGEIELAHLVTIDPLDSRTAYAARRRLPGGGSIYKTVDGGRHWVELSGGLSQSLRPTSILIDPRNPLTVYVGSECGQGWTTDPTGAGVFKSIDGGLTWTETDLPGPEHPCVISMALDPASPDHLYLTPGRRSLDGGKTWQSWTGPLPGGDIVVDRDNSTRRYGTVERDRGYLLVSEDSGATWQQFTPGGILPGPAHIVTALDIDPITGRLFLGTELGLYRSGDGGRQWAPIEGAGRESVVDLSVDPRDGSVILATESGVFVSERFPWSEWNELGIGHGTRRVQQLRHASAPPGALFASFRNERTIYRSGDFGAIWSPAGPPLPRDDHPNALTAISGFAVTPRGDLFVQASHVIQRSLVENTVRLYLLEAGSSEWVAIDPPVTASNFSSPTNCCLTVDPQSSTVYLGQRGTGQNARLVRSSDDGRSWEIIDLPSGLSATQILIHGADQPVLIVVTREGVLRSVDGGSSWDFEDIVVSHLVPIVQSPADSRVLYMWGEAPKFSGLRIFRSVDAGATWEERGSGPVAFPHQVWSLAAGARNPLVLYASTTAGVFGSSDGGLSWQSLGEGLPGPVLGLSVDPSGSFLFAGVHDRSVWRLQLTSRRRPVARP